MDADRITRLLDRIGWPEWDSAGGVRWRLGITTQESWYRESPTDGRVYLTDYEALALIEKHLREWLWAEHCVSVTRDYSAPHEYTACRVGETDELSEIVGDFGPGYLTALLEAAEAAEKEKK